VPETSRALARGLQQKPIGPHERGLIGGDENIKINRLQKITFAEMRASGVRGVLIYCSDYRCSHHIAVTADQWADDVRLSDIEPRFVCTACDKRGADIRPDFPSAKMGIG
jgi:hypothetical protein